LKKRQKLLDLASKVRSNKEKHNQKSRRQVGTTFTPPTPEKTIKKKKKTQNLQSPNNGSEKVSHHWNPGRGEKQMSTGSNQGDKTKVLLAQRLGGRQNKTNREEGSLPPLEEQAHKGFSLKGFLCVCVWKQEPFSEKIVKVDLAANIKWDVRNRIMYKRNIKQTPTFIRVVQIWKL
jgi:hypothetical protein